MHKCVHFNLWGFCEPGFLIVVSTGLCLEGHWPLGEAGESRLSRARTLELGYLGLSLNFFFFSSVMNFNFSLFAFCVFLGKLL